MRSRGCFPSGVRQMTSQHHTSLVLGIVSLAFLVLTMISYFLYESDYGFSCQAMRYFDGQKVNPHGEIFFAEIAGNPFVGLRAACSIESAARHHPGRNVTLYHVSALEKDHVLKTLLELPNVLLRPLNLSAAFAATPLAEWYRSGVLDSSLYPVEKLSDAVRYALLWTKGGIYLDTDVIVLRPLDRLSNAIGLEHFYGSNGAVLVFDRSSPFVGRCMERFLAVYSGYRWGTEGPGLLTGALHEVCADRNFYIPVFQNLHSYTMNSDACKGVNILPRQSFYPVPWPLWPELFSVVSDYRRVIRCSYAVHLWNSLSKGRRARVGSGNLIDVLARENCPHIYESVMRDGGIGL